MRALRYLVKNQVERIFKVLEVVTKRNICGNPRVVKTFYVKKTTQGSAREALS